MEIIKSTVACPCCGTINTVNVDIDADNISYSKDCDKCGTTIHEMNAPLLD